MDGVATVRRHAGFEMFLGGLPECRMGRGTCSACAKVSYAEGQKRGLRLCGSRELENQEA